MLLCTLWLASYVVGDSVPALRASLMALVLTAVHVGSAVLVAPFAGFLVSRTFTSAGQALLPEMASRWVLLGVGLWLSLHAITDRSTSVAKASASPYSPVSYLAR